MLAEPTFLIRTSVTALLVNGTRWAEGPASVHNHNKSAPARANRRAAAGWMTAGLSDVRAGPQVRGDSLSNDDRGLQYLVALSCPASSPTTFTVAAGPTGASLRLASPR